MTIITSKSNVLIKKTKKLLQKKYRKTSYLIEGWHLFNEACQHKASFKHIFVTSDNISKFSEHDKVTVVSDEVLRELSTSKTPQGIVAEVALSQDTLPERLSGKYLFLEDLQDPGNVGTIIRTADAAGLDAVFISDKSADIYNQKTLRSMQGSHFHLPIYRLATTEILDVFRQSGVTVIASTLSKQSQSYKKLAPKAPFVLVLGNEGQGISPMMVQRADQLVHIEMPGQAESLNVAVAAGILIFSLI